jgi:hypothetical protein
MKCRLQHKGQEAFLRYLSMSAEYRCLQVIHEWAMPYRTSGLLLVREALRPLGVNVLPSCWRIAGE